MNIDEAIEILEDIKRNGTEPGYPTDENALKLGIEALKERAEAIRQGLPLWHELLPGETKD